MPDIVPINAFQSANASLNTRQREHLQQQRRVQQLIQELTTRAHQQK